MQHSRRRHTLRQRKDGLGVCRLVDSAAAGQARLDRWWWLLAVLHPLSGLAALYNSPLGTGRAGWLT